MSKRPLKEVHPDADDDRAAKRARLGVLADGSEDELGARLEAATSVAKRAVDGILASMGGGKLQAPVVRSFIRGPVASRPAHMPPLPVGAMGAQIDFAQEYIGKVDTSRALKGKRFPVMSSSLGTGAFNQRFFDDMIVSWSLCTSIHQKNDLVECMEEISHQIVRIEERIGRHAVIVARVKELFDLETTTGTALFTASGAARLALFHSVKIEFPPSLEAQEAALAFLEAMVQLSKYRDEPLPAPPGARPAGPRAHVQ